MQFFMDDITFLKTGHVCTNFSKSTNKVAAYLATCSRPEDDCFV